MILLVVLIIIASRLQIHPFGLLYENGSGSSNIFSLTTMPYEVLSREAHWRDTAERARGKGYGPWHAPSAAAAPAAWCGWFPQCQVLQQMQSLQDPASANAERPVEPAASVAPALGGFIVDRFW